MGQHGVPSDKRQKQKYEAIWDNFIKQQNVFFIFKTSLWVKLGWKILKVKSGANKVRVQHFDNVASWMLLVGDDARKVNIFRVCGKHNPLIWLHPYFSMTVNKTYLAHNRSEPKAFYPIGVFWWTLGMSL